ncbi:PREDICTED: xylogen-like protein 11 [Tarenaya hassleriana]|uniref:xylogen-like protein 11 n=1 Tax=Tarenaya hassleriana TaxID=28532 RepID=UPI00053C307F|nr:PREDICTED: xylogen-like protein 11 [Tarenaya hassleriana]
MATADIVPVLILLLSLSYGGAWAQSPPAPEPSSAAADGPSPPANCLRRMLNVSDCLSYVQVGSNETKPDGACCPELAGMVESSPECVCNLLGGGASARFGVKLDKQRAMELPSVCGVAPPSPSLCSVLGFPADSPAGSEGSSSDSQTSSEGGGNKNGSSTVQIFAGLVLRTLLLLVGVIAIPI